MNQLDLFADSPREYNSAMHFLGGLEIEKCRQALVQHAKRFPSANPPVAALEACDWLEHTLSRDSLFGSRTLDACIALRNGIAPGFSALPTVIATNAIRNLALTALDEMKNMNVKPTDIASAGLPWGSFFLFAGMGGKSIAPLKAAAVSSPLAALPRILLGDALWSISKRDECLEYYRDGYGRDPNGSGWRPLYPRVDILREKVLSEQIFSDEWWVVGGYLTGRFPRFRSTVNAETQSKWLVFEQALSSPARNSVIFFLGIELSELGLGLEMPKLKLVRKTLAKLHPEGFSMHMELISKMKP